MLASSARYAFLPLIEDPFTLWGLGADRYRVIIARYRRNLPPGQPLAVDINIVERTQVRAAAHAQAARVGILHAPCCRADAADVTYLYADQTLEAADMPLAVCALGPITLTACPDGQVRYKAKRQLLWHIDRGPHRQSGWLPLALPLQPPACCSPPARTRSPHVASASRRRRSHIEDITGNIVQAQRLAAGVGVAIAAIAAVSLRCTARCRQSVATGSHGTARRSIWATALCMPSHVANIPLCLRLLLIRMEFQHKL